MKEKNNNKKLHSQIIKSPMIIFRIEWHREKIDRIMNETVWNEMKKESDLQTVKILNPFDEWKWLSNLKLTRKHTHTQTKFNINNLCKYLLSICTK